MATNNTQDQKPKYASILMDPDRVIHGADFLEEHATNRSLPGIPPYAGASYLTTDVAAAQVRYKSEEDGWIHYPSERVLKRRARAEKAKATRAAKKTGKVEEAAAGGGGGAAKAEESEDESEEESEDEFEEEAEMKEWVGDIGKGERKYERVNFKGTSYLWETVKGERQYLGALKTKKDGSYTVDKKVVEPELE